MLVYSSNLDNTIPKLSVHLSNPTLCLQGDLGGPLVCKENGTWFLMGVYNYGGECKEGTDSTQPRVFTQLTMYENWIDKETRERFFRPVINTPPPKPDTDRCSFDSPRGTCIQ